MGWSILFKIVIAIVICALLVKCIGKKKAPDGLDGWLDLHFPDQFKVIYTLTENPIKLLSFSVKNSVLASKSDSLLQIKIRWDKRLVGLGINKVEIDNSLIKAKAELADTRILLDQLKSSGLQKFSCCIYLGDVRILIFEEPTSNKRAETLKQLLSVLSKWSAASKYGLVVDFMEAKSFGTEVGDIIPLVHWQQGSPWQRQNSILSIQNEPGYSFNPDTFEKKWQFNTESDRLLKWIDQSRPVALKWAKSHLKKSIELLSEVEYTIQENGMDVQIKFGFTQSSESTEQSNVDGYIVGIYVFDGDQFENLKFAQE
ncbi:MAG: hypothetical protein IPL31_09935 [Saprospiraceae bacterium]|nr:hypothetical protein [Saprospiraceae bacterium]